jgi:hypothetical protein
MWFEFVPASRTLVFPTFLWLRRYFMDFAVAVLFGNRFDRIVVEFRGVVREFEDGEEGLGGG